MTIRADAEDFGEEFLAACEAAALGEEVLLTRNGVRLAALVPLLQPPAVTPSPAVTD